MDGNRPHSNNVNNMKNCFDLIHYKAGHDLLITYEVSKQTPD